MNWPHDGGQGAGRREGGIAGWGEILIATPHLPSDCCDGTDEYNSGIVSREHLQVHS